MPVYTPLGQPFDVDDTAGQQIVFGGSGTTAMGSVSLTNYDTTNSVYFAFDAQPVVETANPYTPGNFVLPAGKTVSLNRAYFSYIGVICDTGLTALVQAIGTQGAQA